MKKILIIDDEEKLRTLLARIISLEGFEVIQAADCTIAWKRLEQTAVDVILCDVKLPDGSGIDFSKKVKDKYPIIEIIMLTAYGNIPDGVQAIKNGAFDYIIKGDDNNKIVPLIYRAVEKVDLTKRVFQLEKQLGERHSFEKIIGESKSFQKAMYLAKKVATTDTTVLLTVKLGLARKFLHKHFIKKVKEVKIISSPSIVLHSVKTCLKAKCLVINLVLLQELPKIRKAYLKRPTMVLFF